MKIKLPSYDVKLARLIVMKKCIEENPDKGATELAKMLNISWSTFYVRWRKLSDPEFLKVYRGLQSFNALDYVIIDVPSYNLELVELVIIKKCIDDNKGLKIESQLHNELNIGNNTFFVKKRQLKKKSIMQKLGISQL